MVTVGSIEKRMAGEDRQRQCHEIGRVVRHDVRRDDQDQDAARRGFLSTLWLEH